MNEEEAIERLKYIDRQYDCNNYYSRYDLDCIETVLNLLEKKDEEIERLRYIKKNFDYVVQKETEKKNKIIDEMVEEIESLYVSLVEEFGAYSAEYSKDRQNTNKEEIKQYYERKVENG